MKKPNLKEEEELTPSIYMKRIPFNNTKKECCVVFLMT